MFPHHCGIQVITLTLTLAASFVSSARAKPPSEAEQDITPYVIAAADDGSLMRPRAYWKGNKLVAKTERMTEEAAKNYLEAMIGRINRAPRDAKGRRKVLIFTHGGMNRRSGAIVRAAKIVPKLKKEYHPIFIAWNSEPFSCYGEHLLRVRQGQKRDPIYGFATSPFYLLADLARGVSRAPLLWARMIENALTQPAGLLKNSPRAQRYVYAHEVARYLRQNDATTAPEVTEHNLRQLDWRGRETIGSGFAHTVFFPTKTIGSFILDTIGTGAWDIMLRRANELFDSPIRAKDFGESMASPKKQAGPETAAKKDETDRDRIRRVTEMVQNRKPHQELPDATKKRVREEIKALLEPPRDLRRRKVDYHARARPGAVELLMRRLDEEEAKCREGKCKKANCKKGEPCTRYSITLVGHSMGAIVSNEMLKRHPKLSFDKIIYLAAACSVKDAQDSVVPYLRRRFEQNDPAHFYNLSLHPVAETCEAIGGDPGFSLGGFGATAAGLVLVPRGSLLEWLDDFFTKPVNLEERRLGKWTTAITSVEIFPEELRQFVHLKMFPVGPATAFETPTPPTHDYNQIPQEHGKFADGEGKVKFWDKSFLDPSHEYKGLDAPKPARIDRQ